MTSRKDAVEIPISAAKRIADLYGYDQVVIVARKVGATGVFFTEQRGDQIITGYKTSLKKSGEQQTRNEGLVIRGDLYKPTGDCADCCPPWKICDRPCADRIAA